MNLVDQLIRIIERLIDIIEHNIFPCRHSLLVAKSITLRLNHMNVIGTFALQVLPSQPISVTQGNLHFVLTNLTDNTVPPLVQDISDLTVTTVTFTPTAPGDYSASFQALDGNGQVLGAAVTSNTVTIPATHDLKAAQSIVLALA